MKNVSFTQSRSTVHVKYHLPLECVNLSNMRVNVIPKRGDVIETVSKIGDVQLEELKIQVMFETAVQMKAIMNLRGY